MDYQDLLDKMHQHILPNCYLEIGVRTGGSARLVLPGTKAILIDPEPMIRFALPEFRYLEACTSDHFFADRTAAVGLKEGDIDLAYIDGMHLFEYAFRDFLNVERFARHDSVIVIDDCIPPDELSARRERDSRLWAGDVWRVLLALDEIGGSALNVVLVDVEPAGMAVVTGVNPERNLSGSEVEQLVARYADSSYDDFVASLGSVRRVRPAEWSSISHLMPDPVRSDNVINLIAARDGRKEGWQRRIADVSRAALGAVPPEARDRLAPVLRRVGKRLGSR